jgi:hypothetical protein
MTAPTHVLLDPAGPRFDKEWEMAEHAIKHCKTAFKPLLIKAKAFMTERK